MMKSVLKATAALAVMAGTSGALGQTFCNAPGLFIPDDPSVMDTINVVGGPSSITNMAVTVNILHTWDSDVTMVLVHNGVTLNLTAGNGGSGDNFIGTRFIDGVPSITTGAPPFTGDFAPEGGDPFWVGTIAIPGTYLANFAGFAGMDGNGAWDLVIDDTVGGDTGTLQDWCIDFNPGAPPPPPPPPPGDDCGAPLIALDGSNPLDTVNATTGSAFPCGFNVQRDVNFAYTATATGVASFSTCGSGFDTVMMLGTSCGAGDLGCLDDFCGLQTTMTTGVVMGQTYYITIGGYNGQQGTGTLDIVVSPPAANDECLTATVLNGEGVYPFDNTAATTNGFLSCGFGGSPGYNDVWYEYIAGITGDVFVETCGLTTVDTQLAVFDACGGVELACNDDSCGTLQSKTPNFAVTAGTHYWIRLSGWSAADTGTGSLSIAQYVPPPPGDDCFQPFAVGDGVHAFDTTGTQNNYAGTCGASGGSPDIFFLWTVSGDGCADIALCGSSYDTVVEVIGSCAGPSIVCNDDACGGTFQSQVQVGGVTAGQQLLIRVSGYNNAAGAGTMTLSVVPSTPYNQPSGTDENETCTQSPPDTVNGGCNSTPNIFGSIGCGETILGTGWCNQNVNRDTDGYTFTLAADDTVTITGQAEFPVQMYILDGTCPWITLFGAATNTACTPDFSYSGFLAAGTYTLWMGTNGFGTQVTCGTGDRYWVNLALGSGCPVACDGDVNCDFALDGFDVEVQEKAVGGDTTDYCQPDPDFNGDFALDGFDVEAVEIVVGGGPCP